MAHMASEQRRAVKARISAEEHLEDRRKLLQEARASVATYERLVDESEANVEQALRDCERWRVDIALGPVNTEEFWGR